jgi:hypothetical protein
MTRRFVMVLIPVRLIPLRAMSVGTRVRLGMRPVTRWLGRSFGRRIACHCLSVLALIARWIAANGTPADLYRAFLCRHCCQSSIITVTRCRSQ